MNNDNNGGTISATQSMDQYDEGQGTRSSPTKLMFDTLKTPPRNPDASMLMPLAISYAISSLLIVIIGTAGIYFFGAVDFVRDENGNVMPGCEDRVCQNIILNLDNGVLKNLVGSALIVAIILGYVLILAPAREHIELIVESYFNMTEESHIIKNVIRATLVLLTACIAIGAPYFGSVLGAVGGLTDALQSFVLPPLIGIGLFQNVLTLRQKLTYYSILLFGIFTIFYTILQIYNAAILE